MRADFRGLLRLAVLVPGVVLAAGCDQIVGFESLPAAAPASNLPPRFACLDRPTTPAGRGENIALGLRFIEATGSAALAPLTLTVCPALDVACETPVTSVVTSMGDALLIVPTSVTTGEFFGQVRVRAEGYFPTAVMFRPAPKNDRYYTNVVAIDRTAISFIPPFLGVDAGLVDGRGHLLLSAFGCDGAPAAGLELEVAVDDADGDTVAFTRDGTFVARDTSVTRGDGFSGILNIPISDDQEVRGLKVVVRDVETGLAVSESAADVRRGEATMIMLSP